MQVCAWGLDPQAGAANTRERECLWHNTVRLGGPAGWPHGLRQAHSLRMGYQMKLHGAEALRAGWLGIGGLMGLSGWWQLWSSCLGFLCPRGPGLGEETEPWAAAAVSPASCLTSCLLPFPAGSEGSGKHSAAGLVAAEGGPDKLNLPTGVGAGSHPWKLLLAQKAAKEKVWGRKERVDNSKDEMGHPFRILYPCTPFSVPQCTYPLTYFIMHPNRWKRFVRNAHSLVSPPTSKF